MLTLHDTLSRKTKPVAPTDRTQLRFYCCGPTVYGPAHIGNFRTFLVQDLFRRVVELDGTPTRHVRNITDVDDKTIRESIAAGVPLIEFAAGWKQRFHDDCGALNMLPPHVEPGAVDHITEQVNLISDLLDKGLAYATGDGSVYFRVCAYPEYGKLSGVKDRELLAGASGAATATDADEYGKDDVADFALWKARKPEDGDNAWPSPWGEGRPGWHLECSAMGMKYLGRSFDLHSGGVDLCFPHHENEIAQSEGATGEVFAHHWFHIEHLMVDGAKMSKSLGNLYTLADLEAQGYTADELRYALLAGHYRGKLNFSLKSLHDARLALARLASLRDRLAQAGGTTPTPFESLVGSKAGAGVFSRAWDSLLEDLNTPAALGALFSAAKPLESKLADGSLTADQARAALAGLSFINAAFGWVLPPTATGSQTAPPPEVRELADQRWAAKQSRDWATADRLRDEITALGWSVKDRPDTYDLTPS